MKKTKRILIEEDEPSQRDIEKAAKKVKGMKSGKPVRVRKAWTDPKRNYAQEALKTGAENAAKKNAASRAKPDRVKPSTERVYTSTEITKAKRDATKKRVGRGESSRKISNKEATILIRAREMTEYQRIGAVLAEAMGHRVDELAPVLAGLGAGALAAGRVAAMGLKTAGTAVARGGAALGRGVVQGTKAATTKAGEVGTAGAKKAGTMIKDKAVDMATEKAIDKAKEKLVGESETMNKFVKKLMEWKAGPIASRIAKDSPAGAEGRMSKTKRKKISRDPVVDSDARKTQRNVDRKLGTKTNLRVKDAVQGALNRRRGKTVIPKETKKDAKADADRDKYRRMAPGDK